VADLTFQFSKLDSCDLIVGAVYESGSHGTLAEEPLDRLLHCGNMGGFRIRGSISADACRLAALFTTFEDPNWPDTLDIQIGHLVYFGDNKTPGRALHETPKGGNELLRRSFEHIHVTPQHRERVPPFFIFSKAGRNRDVRFHGLAVPGGGDVSEAEDLVAIWKTVGASRFQNYRAVFTVLDARRIERAWIDELLEGRSLEAHAPEAWRDWVLHGVYRPLQGRRETN
jgi:hypothetical protein